MKNIKISRTIKWVMTLGILLILLAASVILYLGQQTKHNQLGSDLSSAQDNLIASSQEKDQLESRLREVNLTLPAWVEQFPISDQSMTLQEALYGAADEAGVEITTLGCPPAKPETQGTITYQVFMVTVSADGEMESLLGLLGHLGSWLPSASVESASVSILSEGNATLSMTLKVYALGAA